MPEFTPLRTLLARKGCLTLPGVYDGISARMADSLGFEALYMTGYGAVASALGLADAGLATFTEMLDRVRCVAGAVRVPFIAAGDTGVSARRGPPGRDPLSAVRRG